MLHVNDDNNDELFRKAAADYFLGADDPNWQEFTDKAGAGISQAIPEDRDSGKHKKRRRLFPFPAWFHYKNAAGNTAAFLRRLIVWHTGAKKKIEDWFYHTVSLQAIPGFNAVIKVK